MILQVLDNFVRMNTNNDHTNIQLRLRFLRKVSIFTEVSDEVLNYIALALTPLSYVEGDIVFHKGDPGNSMFIITSGSVKIHDQKHIFTVFQAGNFFGEFSLIDSSSRSATVTALETTTLLRLEQQTFYHLMSNKFEVAKGVLKALVKRVYDKDALEEELAERNAQIMQQKEEIEAQRDEIQIHRDYVVNQRDQIQAQKESITASIQYARRIQSALLPPDKLLNNYIPENFILYRPRDIVSGDFYWLKAISDTAEGNKNKLIIVAADCTGHGVPGAFMSILGVAFLNEITGKMACAKASCILNDLRNNIISALRQKGNDGDTKDGMDLALIIIDFEKNELHFAGAFSPLYIMRKRTGANSFFPDNLEYLNTQRGAYQYEQYGDYELLQIKGDRMPIGFFMHTTNEFKEHTIRLKKDDRIYMFSDGYADQFGGKHGRKFLIKKFRHLLFDIQSQTMRKQLQILEDTFLRWKGNFEQIDDIMIIGLQY